MTTNTHRRYITSKSAGQRNGRSCAVIDSHDAQSGKGMRRVSFHRTMEEARAEARKLNAAAEAMPTASEWMEQR
jgi:hypothetical protein